MIRPTPRQLRAVYEVFRALPPFCGWRLPPADQVRFTVTSRKGEYGRYEWNGGHHISVSRRNVQHFHSLALTMAHEMLHLKQRITKTDNRYQHNAEFMRLAKRVCLTLGFDSKGFS